MCDTSIKSLPALMLFRTIDEIVFGGSIESDEDGELDLNEDQIRVFQAPPTPRYVDDSILDLSDVEDMNQAPKEQEHPGGENQEQLPAAREKAPPITSEGNSLMVSSFQEDNLGSTRQDFALPPVRVKPPPARPANYDTVHFPALKFADWCCPAIQLAFVSANFKAAEERAYNSGRIKDGRFVKLYNSSRNGKKFCRPCSELISNPQKVYHKHFSSHLDRMLAQPDYFCRYMCHQCADSPHMYLSGGRLPVMMTSSTLNNYHGIGTNLGYRGDSLHCDLVSVPGGRISDLDRAFKGEYGGYPLPIDVLGIVGLNNVLNASIIPKDMMHENFNSAKGLEHLQLEVDSALYYMKKEATDFRKTVLEAAPPGRVNSFALAQLPSPPCLSWTETGADNYSKNLNLVRGHRSKLLNNFNIFVKSFNQETQQKTGINTSRAPTFRAWGLSKRSSSNMCPSVDINPAAYLQQSLRGPYIHRFNDFREAEVKDQLHFGAYTKLKMGRAGVKYFRMLYELDTSLGENKAEGTLLKEALKTMPAHKDTLQETAYNLRRARGVFKDPKKDRCRPSDIQPFF